MKHKILLILTFLVGMFTYVTNVSALTKINFSEKANGQIETALHFEEGFVGGIDITFNVDGDVSVKDFKFSSKITSGNYEQNFNYDANKKTLTIHVTTGGIGSSHNLLNEKKELQLGTMIFETSAQKDVKYKLNESAFTIVDNNWASKTIEKSHITLGDNVEFTYKFTNNESSKEDDDKNEQLVETTKPNNATTETNNNDSLNNTLPTDDSNNQVTDDDKEDKKDNVIVDDDEKIEDNSNLKHFLIITGVAIAIMAIGSIIYVLIIKKKNED